MGILISCASGSNTSLMTIRSVKKAVKELGIPTTKIYHCAISGGRDSASQYGVVFTPVNLLQMFQQAEKRGVTVIDIKNAMSAKETQEKYMISDRYQKSE